MNAKRIQRLVKNLRVGDWYVNSYNGQAVRIRRIQKTRRDWNRATIYFDGVMSFDGYCQSATTLERDAIVTIIPREEAA